MLRNDGSQKPFVVVVVVVVVTFASISVIVNDNGTSGILHNDYILVVSGELGFLGRRGVVPGVRSFDAFALGLGTLRSLGSILLHAVGIAIGHRCLDWFSGDLVASFEFGLNRLVVLNDAA